MIPQPDLCVQADRHHHPPRKIEMKTFLITAATCCLLFTPAAWSQEVKRTLLPANHPLIGSWRIDVPGTQCHEVYDIKTDGTMSVTSGAQAAESEFEIDIKPSARGFYKWVDKIVKDNGKPDCMGRIMQVGHVSTVYIIVHRSGREFLICKQESLDTCIGPFRKQGSNMKGTPI